MSAMNHISFFGCCPSCRKEKAHILAQAAVAASFASNSEGIFSGKIYNLGEKILWYPEEHKLYSFWTLPCSLDQIDGRPNEVVEVCESECMDCGSEGILAAILFKDLRPTKVLSLRFEEEYSLVEEDIMRFLAQSESAPGGWERH